MTDQVQRSKNDLFIYFDLGNVLLQFDHQLASRQMAEVSGVPEEVIRRSVFEGPLQLQYERGDVSSREFYSRYCEEFGVKPDYRQLLDAASDIFHPAGKVIQFAGEMKVNGWDLGLLSNTCDAHWQWIQGLQLNWLKDYFVVRVLSYQVHCLKPDPEMYRIAEERAQRPPRELLLIDDRHENVAGARAAGWDAIEFVGLPQLLQALRCRGIDVING